jgi:glycosyltransferase involved in cell wall biosynthesis
MRSVPRAKTEDPFASRIYGSAQLDCDRLRIVHALAYYGNYFGGIQHSVNEVSKRQSALGHDVKIITSSMFGNDTCVDGVPVRRLRTIFEAFRVPYMPSLPVALLEEACDVLHVYAPFPSLDVWGALKKRIHRRTKLVLSIRNFLPNPTSVFSSIAGIVHDDMTIRLAIAAADAVVFTNRQFALSVPYTVPKEKMFIVPNGVDTDVFRPDPDYVYYPNLVLFVGRLIPEKGLSILVRAMRVVQEKVPDVKLVAVVSDYYNQRRYLDEVMRWDNGFLELRSRLPLDKLAQLYRSSAVFVLPSIGLESFGNVLVEAMASGCPVIATDVPGPMGLVESGFRSNVGRVTRKGNVEELAKAIVAELQSNGKERRMGIAEFARSRASWDIVTRQILSVYEKCGA